MPRDWLLVLLPGSVSVLRGPSPSGINCVTLGKEKGTRVQDRHTRRRGIVAGGKAQDGPIVPMGRPLGPKKGVSDAP